MTEKINNITPISKKPTPTTAITTYKPPTSFAPLVGFRIKLFGKLIT